MRMLSIRGNNFIAHWACEETISSHAEHSRNKFSHMLSQRKNVNSFYMYNLCCADGEIILSHPEHRRKLFKPWLSIRGNDFIADWACAEMLKSRISHLGLIKYDCKKSLVTCPCDHKDSVSAKKVKKISCLCTFNWLASVKDLNNVTTVHVYGFSPLSSFSSLCKNISASIFWPFFITLSYSKFVLGLLKLFTLQVLVTGNLKIYFMWTKFKSRFWQNLNTPPFETGSTKKKYEKMFKQKACRSLGIWTVENLHQNNTHVLFNLSFLKQQAPGWPTESGWAENVRVFRGSGLRLDQHPHQPGIHTIWTFSAIFIEKNRLFLLSIVVVQCRQLI